MSKIDLLQRGMQDYNAIAAQGRHSRSWSVFRINRGIAAKDRRRIKNILLRKMVLSSEFSRQIYFLFFEYIPE